MTSTAWRCARCLATWPPPWWVWCIPFFGWLWQVFSFLVDHPCRSEPDVCRACKGFRAQNAIHNERVAAAHAKQAATDRAQRIDDATRVLAAQYLVADCMHGKHATVEDVMREGRRIATEVEDWRGKP